jgi:hypothetical protein
MGWIIWSFGALFTFLHLTEHLRRKAAGRVVSRDEIEVCLIYSTGWPAFWLVVVAGVLRQSGKDD